MLAQVVQRAMPPVRHQKFRDALKRSRDAHDKVEAWLFDEVDHVLNGGQCIKYFAAGRCSDATTFCACLASEKDTHGLSYQLAFRDLLRNAGERVKVRTKHKLTFDYGTEFWDGRSYSPDASTDGRVYASPTFCESVDLGVPLSEGALRDVLRARASRAEKVAALRRALDYFGISGEIEVPPSRFFRWRRARRVDAAEASPRQLARALRVCLAWE